MIVQNAAKNGLTDFSFTVNRNDLDKAIRVIESEVARTLKKTAFLLTLPSLRFLALVSV